MKPYCVMERSNGGVTVYAVHDANLRCVSKRDLSHDDAVALCERLNREAETA